ncbi:MAG: hypothetical protein WA211_09850 [Candidatus Acidiferrales bacterium]
MHVTSHISNSQGDFSPHEMPILKRVGAEACADAGAKPRATSALRDNSRALSEALAQKSAGSAGKTARPKASIRNPSNPTEVKNENLQH